MTTPDMIGWDMLRHGGLLLDPQRVSEISAYKPEPLDTFHQDKLRRQAAAVLDGTGDVSSFVSSVLESICGFTAESGTWLRGSSISKDWSRSAVRGELVRPRQLWQGKQGGILPVFIDSEKRVGIGRGRRATSRAISWLRGGSEYLALVTNGRQWRLIFAGLDFDAWCEWDLDLWFEEGELSPQVTALRTLLQPDLWTPQEEVETAPFHQAILDSRKGQSELSKILGERIREAVELLVQGHGEILKERCADVDHAEIYRAAVRVIMRMVVVLFAESRELLPRENALYHKAYGLTGLLEELDKAATRSRSRLAYSWSAWPRVLALFRLVYDGSHHPDLPVPAYGGELFAPGDPDSLDGLTRALSVFETSCFDCEVLSDRDVHSILELITRTKVKLRQGKASTWVPAPVDFSDLSSEYIGILYEGLLDFELRTAPEGDPVIFLAIGNQPALPLSRLEAMDDKALKNLLEKMKDTSSGDEEEEEAEEEASEEELEAEAEDGAEEEADEDEDTEEEAMDEEGDSGDLRHTTRTRAEEWARGAVEVGKLARKPRGKLTPERKLLYEDAISRKARQLVTRVVLPGEWYLVRWGGTRKGSGTFYTRPGLAVPTVQRTLRPLAWDQPMGADGEPDRDVAPTAWTPKKPEEILALKIVDPACGSGTFPLGALRYLTESLYSSLHYHGRLSEEGDRTLVALLTDQSGGEMTEEHLSDEMLPCRPDDDLFEPRLKAVLRRYVVERCIYGVDIDPLAVELCRLSLWIETMDRSLPFSFLDHKIKCGNSLIGTWFDVFRHYPVMAWKNREGGDKNHTNGVHYEKEVRTKAIKRFWQEKITPDLISALSTQYKLFSPPGKSIEDVHQETLETLEKLHLLPVQDAAERGRIYREEFLDSKPWQSLKEAMDLWCACWFWPAELLDDAPLPSNLPDPPKKTLDIARQISAKMKFFHWELEFPDVFSTEGSGFDAVLGNPPWDIAKPNSKEFFSNIDPLYRSYGKQEAIKYQTGYFSDEQVEGEWLDYNADFRAQSNFMKYAASCFGDPEKVDKSPDRFAIGRGKKNIELHKRWRATRVEKTAYADPSHPYQYQGSADINLYKLFLERAYILLGNGGRLGFVVPSGLYSDHGTGDLRELFLSKCQWEWLFGFENREKIFDIDSRFKFNPIVVEKGGETEAIRAAFMRRRLEDWEQAEDIVTQYTRERIERFSPKSKAILEIQSDRDLEILEKIYSNSVLLGDDSPDGWGITYSREFDMTNDSKLFPPRTKWESQGYRPDEYSRWLKGNWRPIEELWAELGVKPLAEGERRCAQPPYDRIPIPRADIPPGIILSREADGWIREEGIDDTALALFQGAMISHLNTFSARHMRGSGATSVWDRSSNEYGMIQPQFLIDVESLNNSRKWNQTAKIAYRRVARTTDARTVIATVLPFWPGGDSIFYYVSEEYSASNALFLASILSSIAYDYQIRNRLGGTNLSDFVMSETAIPEVRIMNASYTIVDKALALCLASNCAAKLWLNTIKYFDLNRAWKSYWAILDAERIRLRASLDAISARLYNLKKSELTNIMMGCDSPIINKSISEKQKPTGFWRVDKDKDPELRYTVLALVAFNDLESKIAECGGDRDNGIEAFLSQNDGEGWMLPETLRLTDYGIGHDERAKEHQPVASRLGPRFYDWQLAQSPEESWRECHLHARNILGEEGYKQLLKDIEENRSGSKELQYRNKRDSSSRAAEKPDDNKQGDLF